MLGRKDRGRLELFITGSPRDLVPDAHVLVRVDPILVSSWLAREVAGLHCPDNGRPGIDPEGEEEEGDDPVDHRPDERAVGAGRRPARHSPPTSVLEPTANHVGSSELPVAAVVQRGGRHCRAIGASDDGDGPSPLDDGSSTTGDGGPWLIP